MQLSLYRIMIAYTHRILRVCHGNWPRDISQKKKMYRNVSGKCRSTKSKKGARRARQVVLLRLHGCLRISHLVAHVCEFCHTHFFRHHHSPKNIDCYERHDARDTLDGVWCWHQHQRALMVYHICLANLIAKIV